MKGFLELELFGEDVRQLAKIYRGVFDVCCAASMFDTFVGVPPRSSWVAEVSGTDEKYRLHREFLRPKLDYSRSNAKGSRGIFAEYILSEGKIYEVKSQESWSKSLRYFCTVGENGDIIKLDEKTACHTVGALTFEERRELRRAERISWDKRP